MAVTRDDVIHTAIQLLQEVGLDALTLRRLATELGITAPTLYWHVKDKRELLDLMSGEMVRMAREKMPPFPAGLTWDEKIAEGLRRQYEALIAYRDGARVVAGNRPTEAALPQIEQFLRMWVDAGFPPSEALAYILSLGDFVTGCALEYQSEIERQRTHPHDESAGLWNHLEAYPTLQAATASRLGKAPSSRLANAGRQHSNFERGLRLMMTGLRLRHAELMAEKQKAADKPRPKASGAN
jgi:TetR/AcrR family tetracycline transcriptional repressor